MRSLTSVLVLIVALTACGGADDSGAKDKERAAEVSASATAAAEEEARFAEASESAAAEREEEERATAQAVYDDCSEAVGPLLESLQEVDSRLSIGMNVGEYNDLVGDGQVAYDRGIEDVPYDESDTSCFAVALGLESALNLHIKAYNAWNDSVTDIDCEFEEGEPVNDKVQRYWVKAGDFTDRADENLDALAPEAG
jgi:hypothetical protein